MKALIVLGFALLSIGHGQLYEEKYERVPDRIQIGKGYLFNYDTQLTVGIPETSQQRAGFRLSGHIRMYKQKIKREAYTFLQIINVTLGQLNRVVRAEPSNILPVSVFGSLKTKEIEEELIQKLAIPIRFKLFAGIVSDMEQEVSDKFYSVNLKKAAVTLFHNNLMQPTSNRLIQMVHSPFAKVEAENTVAGRCLVRYNIRPQSRRVPLVRVVKSPDLIKCRNIRTGDPTRWTLAIPSIFDCAQCSQDEKDIINPRQTIAAEVRVNAGNRQFVRLVESQADYIVLPFKDASSGQIQITSLQRLVYNKTEKTAPQIDIARRYVHMPEQTQLKIPAIKQKKSRKLRSIVKKDTLDLIRQILRVIKKSEDRPREILQRVHRLIHQLRKLKIEDLRDVLYLKRDFDVGKDFSIKRKQQFRKLVLDILPSISSPQSQSLVVELLTKVLKSPEDQASIDPVVILLTNDQLSRILRTSAFNGLVDLKTFKLFIKVISSEIFKSKFNHETATAKGETTPLQVYDAAYLAAGAQANTLFIKNLRVGGKRLDRQLEKMVHRHETETSRVDELELEGIIDMGPMYEGKELSIVRRYFVSVIRKELLHLTGSERQKSLGLSVVHNSGMYDFFKNIRYLVSLGSKQIQVEAVEALTKIARQRSISLSRSIRYQPLYKLRIQQRMNIEAYLLSILESRITDVEVRVKAYQVLMNSRPDAQVINSVVRVVIKSKNPLLLSYVNSHINQMSQSKHICYTGVAAELRQALSILTERPQSTPFSRVFYKSMFSDKLQIGVVVEADQLYIRHSMLPKSSQARLDVQFMGRSIPLVQAGVRIEGQESILDQLSRRFPGLRRTPLFNTTDTDDDSLSKGKVSSYLSILDQKIARYLGDAEDVPSLMDSKHLTLQDSIIYAVDGVTSIPVASGFIGSIDMHASTHITTNGRPQKIDPQMDALATVEVGVSNHLQRSAMKMDLQATIAPQMKVQAESKPEGLVVSWKLPKPKTEIVRLQSKLSAIVEEMNWKSEGVEREISEKEIKNDKHPLPSTIQKTLKLAETGMKLHLLAEYISKEMVHSPPVLLMRGQSRLRIFVSPLSPGQQGEMRLLLLKRNGKYRQLLIKDPSGDNVHKSDLEIKRDQSDRISQVKVITVRSQQPEKIIVETQVERPQVQKLERFGSLNDVLLIEDEEQSIRITSDVQISDAKDQKARKYQVVLKAEIPDQLKQKASDLGAMEDYVQQYIQDDQSVSLLKRCKEEKLRSVVESDSYFTPSCILVKELVSQLTQLLITIEAKSPAHNQALDPVNDILHSLGIIQNPRKVVLNAQQVIQLILHKSFQLSDIPQQQIAEKRISSRWTPSQFDIRVGALNVSTPFLIDQYKDVQLPTVPFHFIANHQSAVCEIRNNHIRNLDQKVISIPKQLHDQLVNQSCPIILAKDCMSKRYEISMAYSQISSSRSPSKEVRVRVGKQMLEIIKNLDTDSKHLIFKLNDERLTEKDGHVEVPAPLNKYIKIERQPNELYKVRITQRNATGSELVIIIGDLDMRTIKLKLPFNHAERVCGLCSIRKSLQSNVSNSTATEIVRESLQMSSGKCSKLAQLTASKPIMRLCSLNTYGSRSFVRIFRGRRVNVAKTHLDGNERPTKCQLIVADTGRVTVTVSGSNTFIYFRGRSTYKIMKNYRYGRLRLFKNGKEIRDPKKVPEASVTILRWRITFRINRAFRIDRLYHRVNVASALRQVPSGVCKTLKQVEVNNPQILYKRYGLHKTCEGKSKELMTCSVKKNTVKQLAMRISEAERLHVYNTRRIDKSLTSTKALIVLTYSPATGDRVLLRHLTSSKRQIVVEIPGAEVIIIVQDLGGASLTYPNSSMENEESTITPDGRRVRIHKLNHRFSLKCGSLHVVITTSAIYITVPSKEREIRGLCTNFPSRGKANQPVVAMRRLLTKELKGRCGKFSLRQKVQIHAARFSLRSILQIRFHCTVSRFPSHRPNELEIRTYVGALPIYRDAARTWRLTQFGPIRVDRIIQSMRRYPMYVISEESYPPISIELPLHVEQPIIKIGGRPTTTFPVVTRNAIITQIPHGYLIRTIDGSRITFRRSDFILEHLLIEPRLQPINIGLCMERA